MIVCGLAYLVLSALVAVLTILDLAEEEDIELSIPIGDMEYFSFNYEYGTENLIFMPSILICEVYKMIAKKMNSKVDE